jgi:hypothetical protein
MSIDDILEEEDICRKTNKNKKEGMVTKPSLVTTQMRKYEKEMLHKLPNEFRWALRDYNYRSEDRSIENDDYNFS